MIFLIFYHNGPKKAEQGLHKIFDRMNFSYKSQFLYYTRAWEFLDHF